MTVLDRFEVKAMPEPNTGCWLWTAQVDQNGYAKISVGGRPRFAHRVAYELLIGLIPAGLQIDHLCRNRSCVNPAHLEPVTGSENVQRGLLGKPRTHCKYGHALTGENVLPTKRKAQRCRICNRRHARDSWLRRKAAV